MSTIAYYISDHGYGHATRSIAIIRTILNLDIEMKMQIHTKIPLKIIHSSLSPFIEEGRVEFHTHLNDPGFHTTKMGEIDFPNTAPLIQNWIQDWDRKYLFDEYCYFKENKVDLIISDIAPQPFLTAKKLDIPSIAITNFTWIDIFRNTPIDQNDVIRMWKAYREASLGIILPLQLENPVFRSRIDSDLVCRNTTKPSKTIRADLGIDKSDLVIYAGTGFSFSNPFQEEWIENQNFHVIIGGTLPKDPSTPEIHFIPSDDPEGQNYIAASDIALLKLGYSSVTEAIRNKKPIIGVDFPNTRESNRISEVIKRLQIGVIIPVREFYSGEWRNYIDQVLELQKNYQNLPSRYTGEGENSIALNLLDLLEEENQ